MTSARTWKIVLGYSLLLVCICAGCALVLSDYDNIICRLAHPIINLGPAQARFTEYQRAFISAIQGDELLRQDRSEEPIEVIFGELYCGCKRGWTRYFYRTQQSAEEVLERFARDIGTPGWRVRYSNADYVEYRNADNTVMALIRMRSERQGIPTVYEVVISFAEPNFSSCSEMG